MNDRALLKEVWSDIVSSMSMFAYLGDPKAMVVLAIADKIRRHLCRQEGAGWEKAIVDKILSEADGGTAKIIHDAEKRA